jgi:sialate O-acetylesterase
LLPLLTQAQLPPASIVSDHMVLQRNHPIHIWGKAIPGENLVVQYFIKK